MQHEFTALTVLVGDEERQISVHQEMMQDAAPILDSMDADMAQGWQLGREFVTSPDTIQRCQIAANRLLTALHTSNDASASLMAAYILSRMTEVHTVVINAEGESEETMFYDHNQALITKPANNNNEG